MRITRIKARALQRCFETLLVHSRKSYTYHTGLNPLPHLAKTNTRHLGLLNLPKTADGRTNSSRSRRVHHVRTPSNDLPAALAFPDSGGVALNRVLAADCTQTPMPYATLSQGSTQ